jgi:hypothetical protein
MFNTCLTLHNNTSELNWILLVHHIWTSCLLLALSKFYGKYGHFAYPKVNFKVSSSIILLQTVYYSFPIFPRRVLGLIYKVASVVRTRAQWKVTSFGNLRAILKFTKNSCVHLRASGPSACHLRGLGVICLPCMALACSQRGADWKNNKSNNSKCLRCLIGPYMYFNWHSTSNDLRLTGSYKEQLIYLFFIG